MSLAPGVYPVDPSSVKAHHWYGLFVSLSGRCAQGIRELRIASELDPTSVNIGIDLADAYSRARNFELAKAKYLEMRELDPKNPRTYAGIALADARAGNLADAENEENKRQFGPAEGIEGQLAYAYIRAGNRSRAEALCAGRMRLDQSSDWSDCGIAVSAELGHQDHAVRRLERDFQERRDWLILLRWDSQFASLHSDPRFQELVRQVGLQ